MMPVRLLLRIVLPRAGRTCFASPASASSGERGGRQNEIDSQDQSRNRRLPSWWRVLLIECGVEEVIRY